jgi:8-oxo-dGTP diphosphatase
MQEEIGLEVEISSLLGVYSDPARDPRFHTVSVVYVAKAYAFPKAGDDAKKAFVVDPSAIDSDKFVFDHGVIFQDYMRNFHAN